MSIIAYYVRIDPNHVDLAAQNLDSVLAGEFREGGCEIVDIDKAYEPLAWRASPLKRAEMAHNNRVMFDDSWPDDEARASVARLSEMNSDDWFDAIEGRSDERIESMSFGLGNSALFSPERVKQLTQALGNLNEAILRENLDFSVMDEQDVQPGYWQEEGDEGGEETFRSYVLTGLERLKSFYNHAAEAGQVVIVGYS